MNPVSNLIEIKKSLQLGVSPCFDMLYDQVSPSSVHYNDMIHLSLRWRRILADENKGIVSYSDRNIEMDRIQFALIQFLDRLMADDFEVHNGSNEKARLRENFLDEFWKPFFGGRTTIVIGTFYGSRFKAWEASTLMGTGDAIALGKIMGILNNVGIKNIEAVPTYNFSGDRYQDNLILIGGPDANIITREFYAKLDSNFKFGNPDKNELTLFDTKTGNSYFSKYDHARKVIGDYGLVFKCKNPFNSDANVILMAGCFGFGTCSAAQVFESQGLLEGIEGFHDPEGFEALVHSDVINDWTQKPSVIQSYRLKG